MRQLCRGRGRGGGGCAFPLNVLTNWPGNCSKLQGRQVSAQARGVACLAARKVSKEEDRRGQRRRRAAEGVVEHTMYQARSAPSPSCLPSTPRNQHQATKLTRFSPRRVGGGWRRREQHKVDNFEVLWGILHVSKMFPPKIK